MFNDKKYYGEIWFAENIEDKCFCILSIEDDDILLETNLYSSERVYKHEQILGIFTGLGYLTFIDCRIRKYGGGISEMRIYNPKYTFVCGQHLIKAVGLRLKKFHVSNDVIVNWVNYANWYDRTDKELSIQNDIEQVVRIDSKGLTIRIKHSVFPLMKKRTELILKNRGSVSFELENEVSVLEAIEVYNTFQRVLQFLVGQSLQFNHFSFECLKCGEWANIHYNDRKTGKISHNYIHTRYDEVKDDFTILVQQAYDCDKFKFCFNKLTDNLMTERIPHAKRFINSLSVFEAFGKLFSSLPKPHLKKYLIHFSEYFIPLGKLEEEAFGSFVTKIVRSRNYHIHGNIKSQKTHTDFELLYISFLIDFVVGYGLLVELNVSDELKEKVMVKGQSVFVNMQATNRILGSETLD